VLASPASPGPQILPYRILYLIMHFAGASAPLTAIWALGDVMLGVVILPNLLALILLSPKGRRAHAQLLRAPARARQVRRPRAGQGAEARHPRGA